MTILLHDLYLSHLQGSRTYACKNKKKKLKEIPDFSMATDLKRLDLWDCSSLVDVPSSIKYLNNLEILDLSRCISVDQMMLIHSLLMKNDLHFS